MLTVVVFAAIVIAGQSKEKPSGPASTQANQTTSTQHRKPTYGAQITLPFTGLNSPNGVVVDTAGNLYITDVGNAQVLKLAAGAAAPEELPFTELDHPRGVGVDSAGNLYVADFRNNRVVKLPAS